jgi:hypothetical protein
VASYIKCNDCGQVYYSHDGHNCSGSVDDRLNVLEEQYSEMELKVLSRITSCSGFTASERIEAEAREASVRVLPISVTNAGTNEEPFMNRSLRDVQADLALLDLVKGLEALAGVAKDSLQRGFEEYSPKDSEGNTEPLDDLHHHARECRRHASAVRQLLEQRMFGGVPG